MLYMELDLGLSLSSASQCYSTTFKSKCGGDECYNSDKKRKFEDTFWNIKGSTEAKTLPLLLWSGGHPNEDDDDDDNKKAARTNCMNKNEEDNQIRVVAGWPPIESWRKKLLQQQQQGHVDANNRIIIRRRNIIANSLNKNSMYVKVRMQGVAITRKIDLKLYRSYQTLMTSLVSMFAKYTTSEEIEGDDCNYTLRFQDKYGNWLLARDDVPWHDFKESVQRLEILRNEN